MSKVQENLIVQLGRMETEFAFRKAAMSLGTIRELEEGHFQIKETDNGYSAGTVTVGSFGAGFSTDKTTNPATVDVYINSKTSQQTEIIIVASCFGIGPIQNNHCKSKLSTVKSAIMVAIMENSKENKQQVNIKNELNDKKEELEQPITSNSLITVVKTETNRNIDLSLYKKLTIGFAVIAVLLYIISRFTYSIYLLAFAIPGLLFSVVSFALSVVILRKDKDWLIQIIAPVMVCMMLNMFFMLIL